ncbi:ATP-binding protein [Undibacterium sp. JH2W]|uniref:ATP-binding protein n=1 Tax=Undibacterium sp. JH2W TaxID=3413037 RepID=UPI003BF25A64
MKTSGNKAQPPPIENVEIALKVIDHLSAMTGYWNTDLICQFSNSAYSHWFGKSKEQMRGIYMRDALGPIFEKNLAHIQAVLRGELQVFEREVVIPDGSIRHSLMTYTPDIVDGKVCGFFVHVADVTPLKKVEFELAAAKEAAAAVAEQELNTLKQTNATLERLGAIGQDITAHLEISVVCRCLYRHVAGLLETSSFSVFLLDDSSLSLHPVLHIESEAEREHNSIELADSVHPYSMCVRERRDICLDIPPEHGSDFSPASNAVPGDTALAGLDNVHSLLCAPLRVADRTIGVMALQAQRAQAYGERERLIFKTLCAYGAIALENAFAYQRLQNAQEQLVAQEKMAALGSLVAGVAHELNTPIGNSVLTSTTLSDKTAVMAAKHKEQTLRRSDLELFIKQVQQASDLLVHSLESAADLVLSFKQIAVDRTTAQRREFDLRKTCHDLCATIVNQISARQHQLIVDIPDGILLDSYPGPLGQVIMNLINNALLHGFEHVQSGKIIISAIALSKDKIQVRLEDNGCGMNEHVLGHIFDPFFTTKMGQGGTGLGLSISYNIVTSILGGKIRAYSQPGMGSSFTLDLPRHAPLQ